MNSEQVQQLIFDALNDFGGYIVITLALVMSISLALWVFNFGFRKLIGSYDDEYRPRSIKTYHHGKY